MKPSVLRDELAWRLTLEADKNWSEFCEVRFQVPMLLLVACQVQLALKHPQNIGPGANSARQFVHQIQETFKERGYVAYSDAIDAGWAELNECSDSGEETTG